MLKLLINNDSRLIIIKTSSNDLSHVKDNTKYKDHIQEELPRLFYRILRISLREMTYNQKKMPIDKSLSHW